MKVLVLAGGQGSRLQPYTEFTPKALMPVRGVPIARVMINRLIKSGFKEQDIILCINQQFEKNFRHEFRDLNIKFSITEKPCGSAGEVLQVADEEIISPFLLCYSDDLTKINYKSMIEHWKCYTDKVIGLLAVTEKVPLDVGVVNVEYGNITGFVEKDFLGRAAWTGTAILRENILGYIHPLSDFARDVFPKIIQENKYRLETYVTNSVWLDTGILSHYLRAQDEVIE